MSTAEIPTPEPETDEVTLPYLNLTPQQRVGLFTASAADRYRLVERVFEAHGRTLAEIPPAWGTSPLQAWGWLVLTVNEIPLDPEQPEPLIRFGIDLSFADEGVRTWTWVVA